MVPFKIKLQQAFFPLSFPLLSSSVSLAVQFWLYLPYDKKGLEYKRQKCHRISQNEILCNNLNLLLKISLANKGVSFSVMVWLTG